MAKIEITVPGERIVEDFTALVPQPTSPSTARAPDVGLVELSYVNPSILVPGPPGPPGPAGSRWYTGVGDPTITGAKLGDYYLDDVTGAIWTWNGTAWVMTGTDLSPDASELLLKIKTVDGAGSGLDADTIDGMDSTEFATDAELAAVATSANNRVLKAGDTMTGTLVMPLGTQALPSIAFASDPNTGLYSLAGDQVGLTTGGGVRLYATTAVIGTTLPVTVQSTTAIPAGGATTMGLKFSSTANFGTFAGSGAPTISAAKGSIYLRSDGAANTRTYVNTDGATGWTPFVDTTASFPEAPIDGLTYGRKNAAWATIVGGAVVSDTAPGAPLQNGQLWFKSNSGDTFIWVDDGNSQQWVQQNILPPMVIPSNYVTATAEARNRIVNGAMQISQEWGNTLGGPVVSPSYYAADQWLVSGALTPGTASIQRVQVATPKGSKDRIRVTVGTAKAVLAAGDYLQMVQYVEGVRAADFQWGTANAKPVVVRFGFKAPAGTYSVAMRTFNGSYSYINPFTVSAAEANTDIERVLTFPAPTAGTWNMDGNAGSFGLSFPIAMGTTYQGASGAWVAANLLGTSANSNGMATAGAVYELYDVGLYLDPNNTGKAPPWQAPDEAEELRACQRYWQRVYVMFSGQVTTTVSYYAGTTYPVFPRTAPAFAGVNQGVVGFPTTVGTLASTGAGMYELRTANVTGNGGIYHTVVTASARM